MTTIRDCTECGAYKYIARDGKCRDCIDTAATAVSLHLDILHHDFRNSPEALRRIADTIDDHATIELTTDRSDADIDLDIEVACVGLYDENVVAEHDYHSYSGSRIDTVIAALDDTLDDAADYDG